jgi:putative SOS response-associated peptidase YedK
MLFSRKAAASPTKVLRLVKTQQWRQGEALRVTTRPRAQVTPGARRLVIRREGLGELALSPMRWGLRGEIDSPAILARPLTSVRTDVLKANPEWRRLLNAQRCVVPAEQFFEWKRVAEVKTREYCIRLRSGKPMMIAGLWNRSDSCGESFAYISCAANPLVSLIHDQMPVLLDQTEVANWFNPDATLESLLASLKPARVEEIELFPVAQKRAAADDQQPSLFDRVAA